MVDKGQALDEPVPPQGFWATVLLGFPLINAGLVWGLGAVWDPERALWPLVAAVAAAELSLLWVWLRRCRVEARGRRLFLAAMGLAAGTVVFLLAGLLVFLAAFCRNCFS